MATQVTQKVLDDITGDEGASLAEFMLDGVNYEIDLTEENRRKLREALAEFIDAGRKVSARTARRLAVTGQGTAPARVDREQTQAIREWARRHGRQVSNRGRIPEVLRIAFEKNDPTLAPAAEESPLAAVG